MKRISIRKELISQTSQNYLVMHKNDGCYTSPVSDTEVYCGYCGYCARPDPEQFKFVLMSEQFIRCDSGDRGRGDAAPTWGRRQWR